MVVSITHRLLIHILRHVSLIAFWVDPKRPWVLTTTRRKVVLKRPYYLDLLSLRETHESSVQDLSDPSPFGVGMNHHSFYTDQLVREVELKLLDVKVHLVHHFHPRHRDHLVLQDVYPLQVPSDPRSVLMTQGLCTIQVLDLNWVLISIQLPHLTKGL